MISAIVELYSIDLYACEHDYRKRDNDKTESNIKVLNEEFLEVTARFFGKMNGSMEAAKSYIDDIEVLLESTLKYVTKELNTTLAHVNCHDRNLIIDKITCIKIRVTDEFKKMNTEQKVQTILTKKGALQLPKKRVFEETKVQIGDAFQTVKSEVTIMPIEHQIKTFLESPKVLDTILKYQDKLESMPDEEYSNFVHGDTWKSIKNNFKDRVVIPIFLYNDEFGPDDSCSPHGSSNKISGYYYK